MDASDLLKKVRKIEIKSRGLSTQLFSGEYHSAFKGRGMTFSEVREYQPGDDIRTIDWNVTARFKNPFVKVYEEERELTVMMLIDVSSSENFGTQGQFKKELLAEICAVLAFSASQNNDKIGVIFFSDKIECFIPPKKGRSHILRIIRELVSLKPESPKTDISMALRYLNNIIKKRSTAFLLSDFMDDNFEEALKIVSKKHDIVALRIYDERENILPNVGLIKLKDSETGETTWVNTSSAAVRKKYELESAIFEKKLKETIRKSGVDFTQISTDSSYVKPLMNLFKKREHLK